MRNRGQSKWNCHTHQFQHKIFDQNKIQTSNRILKMRYIEVSICFTSKKNYHQSYWMFRYTSVEFILHCHHWFVLLTSTSYAYMYYQTASLTIMTDVMCTNCICLIVIIVIITNILLAIKKFENTCRTHWNAR